jgi:streptogramin lyase
MAGAGASGAAAGASGTGGSADGCAEDLDCPGACQTCSTDHTCVALASADDPTGRCAGTCDDAGTCRSKRGQTCTATAAGCLADSPCSPDGVCCNQACTESCLACDVPGSVGTCLPVAAGPPHGTRAACASDGTICGGACGDRSDGACVYPTAACSDDPTTCSAGTLTGPKVCFAGACTDAPTICPSGCSATAKACAEIATFPLPTANCGPNRITVGADDNLWFTELRCNKIGRITVTGTVTEFDVPARGYPTAIVAAPDGNLWFTQPNAYTIGRITPAGVVTEFPYGTSLFETSSGIGVSSSGTLWVTAAVAYVGRLATDGVITWYPVPTQVSIPTAITAGPDGNMWFIEDDTGLIGRVTPSGAITEFPAVAAVDTSAGDYALTAIVTGPDGNLWFTETHNDAIGRMSPDGLSIDHFPVPTPGGQPADITVGPDGNLWFTEHRRGSNLGRVTLDGTVTEFKVPDAGSLSGIVAGPDGNLWITDIGVTGTTTGNSIHRFTM